MKVLIVTTVLPIRGGVTTWIDCFAEKLNKMEIKTKVINTLGSGNKNNLIRRPIYSKIISRLLNCDVIFYLAYLFTRYLLRWRVLKEIKNNELQVIHAQDTNAFLAVYSFCKDKGIKIILSLHGQFYQGGISSRTIEEDSWLGRLLIKEERIAYQKADSIITVSSHTFNYVRRYTDEQKISLIRNFVDTEKFHPYSDEERMLAREKNGYHKDDFVLIFVGRLAEQKGLRYVIEGLSMTCKKLPVKLILVGDGPEKENLHNLTNELGVGNVVRFFGGIEFKELPALYNTADTFITPALSGVSSIDLTPMAILEAMACGLPIITTACGGIKEFIIHEENGLLVEERSSQAIADAILRIYSDNKLRQKLIQNSLKEIEEKYSLDKVVHKVLDIYQLQEGR